MNNEIKNIKMIWKFVKPHKFSFLNSFLCSTVLDLINVAYPIMFGLTVDEVFYNRDIGFFKMIVAFYFITFFSQIFLMFMQAVIGSYIYGRFMYDIKRKVFEKIFLLKASCLHSKQVGNLIANINNDADAVMNFLLWSTLSTLSNFLKLAIAVIFTFAISIKIFVLMFIVVPISVYASIFFGQKVRLQYEAYREKYGQYISWVFEILNGVRDIQLMAGERSVTTDFVNYCARLVRLKIKTSLTDLVSERTNAFIALLSDLSMYILAAVLIHSGELTIGSFVAVLGYMSMAKDSLRFLNESNFRIQSNMVAINRVFELLHEDIEKDEKNASDLVVTEGNISINNVVFGYDGKNYILNDIQLQIKAGERIALVGKSGAGKSTVLGLLLRLYEPSSGNIKIDGKDIRGVTLKSLRKNIGVVQQEALMFDGSISYNLRLGNPKCTEAQMWEACRMAFIDDYIRSLPDGFDTVIGVKGINLSGGQRQRLAIARILIKNPKILILDEATSALDFEAEKAVLKACDALRNGRTSITIAHRLSTIMNSDRVAVLDEGKIVSIDSHGRLLENCSVYQKMFKEQYEGKLVNGIC